MVWKSARIADVAESIEVRLARACDGDALIETLALHGLAAERADGTLRVRYARAESERLANDVCHALEAWISEQRLPLVPTAWDDQTIALRPPGD
jgi:hypothetical protein